MKLTKDAIDEYLNYCKIHKRLSLHSIKAYKIDLNQFLAEVHNDLLEKKIIMNYITKLHETYKPKSVRRKVASISAFFSYLYFEDIIEVNPLDKIRIEFKSEKVLPKTISTDDLNVFFRQLLNATEKGATG